jgi:nicotinamide mononucleotide transporter
MSPYEWVAAALGVINVALVVRRNVWNYPFGIVMVSLYFFIFLDTRLYSDALLQVFFLVVQGYGWRNWVRAKQAAGEVPVGTLDMRERILWLLGTVAFSLVWGLGMARFTNAAAPLIDAFIAGASVAAQILMARRRIENWLLWILVDAVAVPLYASRGLVWTPWLYGLFLLLSIAGLVDWHRALRAQRKAAA